MWIEVTLSTAAAETSKALLVSYSDVLCVYSTSWHVFTQQHANCPSPWDVFTVCVCVCVWIWLAPSDRWSMLGVDMASDGKVFLHFNRPACLCNLNHPFPLRTSLSLVSSNSFFSAVSAAAVFLKENSQRHQCTGWRQRQWQMKYAAILYVRDWIDGHKSLICFIFEWSFMLSGCSKSFL